MFFCFRFRLCAVDPRSQRALNVEGNERPPTSCSCNITDAHTRRPALRVPCRGVYPSAKALSTQSCLNSTLPLLNSMVSVKLQWLAVRLGCYIYGPGIGYWQSANAFSAMALHDHHAGTTTNKETVVNGLNTAFKLWANYDQFG